MHDQLQHVLLVTQPQEPRPQQRSLPEIERAGRSPRAAGARSSCSRASAVEPSTSITRRWHRTAEGNALHRHPVPHLECGAQASCRRTSSCRLRSRAATFSDPLRRTAWVVLYRAAGAQQSRRGTTEPAEGATPRVSPARTRARCPGPRTSPDASAAAAEPGAAAARASAPPPHPRPRPAYRLGCSWLSRRRRSTSSSDSAPISANRAASSSLGAQSRIARWSSRSRRCWGVGRRVTAGRCRP